MENDNVETMLKIAHNILTNKKTYANILNVNKKKHRRSGVNIQVHAGLPSFVD